MEPERGAQLLAECERLVTRNGELEGLLAAERIWRSDVTRALTPLTEALARDPSNGR